MKYQRKREAVELPTVNGQKYPKLKLINKKSLMIDRGVFRGVRTES